MEEMLQIYIFQKMTTSKEIKDIQQMEILRESYKFKGSTRVWKLPDNRKNNKKWNLSNVDIRNPKDVKMQHLGNEQ